MSVRKIFVAPFFVKKLPIFKQCLCKYHASYAGKFTSDIKPFAITNRNEDKLTAKIKSTLSTTNILLTLEKNKKSISGNHLVYALRQFQVLHQKKFYDQQDGYGIWSTANAKEICSIIDLNVGKLKVSDSVKLLQLFRKMKAPSSMKVVQSLYKHINDSVKDLTLVDFPAVSLAIKQMPDPSLAKDLHRTLIKKFINKEAVEYDPRDIEHLKSGLHFTANNLDDKKLLSLFINGINNYKGEIPADTAITILDSLRLMKQYPPGWLELLKRIQTFFIEHILELSGAQAEFILYLMGEKCRTLQKEFNNEIFCDKFYNETLCDVLVEKIIADDNGFESGLSALKSLSYMRHVNKELLDYTCATFSEKVMLGNKARQYDIFKLATLLSCLSVVKHKTVVVDNIKDYLLNNNLLQNCNYEMLCTLTLNLISLDCYSSELLIKVFDGVGNYSKQKHWTFCKIYQKIKTNPSYEGPFPSELQIEEIKQYYFKQYLFKQKGYHRILSYLTEGMGDPIYIKSNISSKLFHLIDYAVAFSKDGSPIPINTTTNVDEKSDSIEYIEDLEVPPESQIVLIFCLSDAWYTRNTKELCSFYSCVGETLEALSYSVVHINRRTFDETPDKEKKAMLMSQIRSKLVHN